MNTNFWTSPLRWFMNDPEKRHYNRNQEKLTKMILMRYEFLDLGTIKLTVGVRRRSQDKVQYGITALEEGETIVPATNTKKKASHKK